MKLFKLGHHPAKIITPGEVILRDTVFVKTTSIGYVEIYVVF